MKHEIREDLAMDLDVVEQMIKESGHMWLETRDRSETGSGPIIISESPDCPVYLERHKEHQGDLPHIDGWLTVQQPLYERDASSFYAAFGSEWHWLLRAHVEVNGKLHKVRAFIKNGRREEWVLSLDMNAGVS